MVDLVRALGFRDLLSSKMVEGMLSARVLVGREKHLINIYSEHIYIYYYLMSPDISAMKYNNYDTPIKCHGITSYSYKGHIRQ